MCQVQTLGKRKVFGIAETASGVVLSHFRECIHLDLDRIRDKTFSPDMDFVLGNISCLC